MDLVLSKVDSPNSSPLNLVLRKRVVPPYTTAKYFQIYWRYEDEPTSPFQFLGQQTVGFAFQAPFVANGREVRLSMIGVSEAGVASQTDPRKGEQTTFTATASEILTLDGNILTLDGDILTIDS